MTETTTRDTRSALIRAGEQLLAGGGLLGPSDREIIAAAGVRNKSGLSYHFGNRRGLVDAILAEHGEVLRVRREVAFSELTVDGAGHDLFRLCRLVVEPYAEFLSDGPREWAYLAIAQAVLEDPHERPEDLPERFRDPMVPQIVELMLGLLDLPAELAAERVLTGIGQVIGSIGARARQQLFGPARRTPTEVGAFTTNLVDMLHGSLVAPASSSLLHDERPDAAVV